jgi:transposase
MGHLLMSDKERQLRVLFEMVKQGRLTLNKVSDQIGIGYRQILRRHARYLKEGDAGLVHKARGRVSNRQNPHREIIINRYKERYEDFGPTLRCWLLAEGLWTRQRKRKPYRQRRERKAQFGELVQIDGSFHDWFEEGCDSSDFKCLLNMVDDATGKTLARMEAGETTAGIFRLLWKWIESYGIPLALYVDLKTVYVSPKKDGWSHVQRVCRRLGIRIIKARSAQAKGRVERKHAVYQDRFVKELRLKGIKTIEGSNKLLDGGFVDDINEKFEKEPRDSESAHRSVQNIELYNIFYWEYDRQVQNDWTISFQKRCYQIEKRYGDVVKAKATVSVRRHLDDAVSVHYKGKPLSVKIIPKRPEKPFKEKKAVLSRSECGKLAKQGSPWGQFNPQWLIGGKTSMKKFSVLPVCDTL